MEIKGLSHSFNGKAIFKDFNLDLDRDEKIVLSGESGKGKSSLMKMILGFLIPDHGEIRFKGQPLNRSNIWLYRKKIAYVPQEIHTAVNTVRGSILETLSFAHNKKQDLVFEDIYQYLDILKLPESILDSRIREISGGEKHRIALAIALLLDRELYLIDEVTASLDNENKKNVIDYIYHKMNKAAIIIAHENEWLGLKNLKQIQL